jgi:hypothetical protein
MYNATEKKKSLGKLDVRNKNRYEGRKKKRGPELPCIYIYPEMTYVLSRCHVLKENISAAAAADRQT